MCTSVGVFRIRTFTFGHAFDCFGKLLRSSTFLDLAIFLNDSFRCIGQQDKLSFYGVDGVKVCVGNESSVIKESTLTDFFTSIFLCQAKNNKRLERLLFRLLNTIWRFLLPFGKVQKIKKESVPVVFSIYFV